MNNFFTKHNIFSFLTILALISNVALSGISNSSTLTYIIKIASSSILILLFYLLLHRSKVSLCSFILSSPVKKILLIALLILLYMAVTLVYSTNPNYGLQKILNILISILPNILVLYYLIISRDAYSYKEIFIFIVAAGFLLALPAILIFQPFDHSTIYQFEPQRWSHVFIGRTISFFTLIVFLYLLDQKESKRIFIYSFFFTIGLYITYLTGLRSALIGLTLFTIVSFIWSLYKKRILNTHLYSIILILVLISLLVYITPQGFSTSQRISNLVKIEDLGFGDDAAILTRVESYKLSWQMFTERPLIGYGFGSFNGYNNIEWTTIQKYPHNILLEILSELGILGFLLFLILCYSIIKKILNAQSSPDPSTTLRMTIGMSQSLQIINHKSTIKNHPPSTTLHPPSSILILFAFSLWMAMFSKDISTQGFLWLFLAAYIISNQQSSFATKSPRH